MIIEEGTIPNDFILKDQDENKISLSDFRGKKVLLSFHPLAWTSTCAKQTKSLEHSYQDFQDLNTIPLGISTDPVPTKSAWADSLGLKKLKILSDFWPHGAAAKLMGVFIKEKGFSGRANILFDENGKVIWVKEYELSELPDIDEVIEVIKKNT